MKKPSDYYKNRDVVVEVDTLFLGGGPATLGVLTNAY